MQRWHALLLSAIGVLPLQLAAVPGVLAQACDVQLVLDQPAEGAVVGPGQRIVSGWAVDQAAAAGTGIEAVRLALNMAPEQLDDAAAVPVRYGLPRPDVAQALGRPQFLEAGFAQGWASGDLAPGLHRLLVQAKSACGWTSVVRTIQIVNEAREARPAPPPPPEGALPLARVPAPPYQGTLRLASFSLTATPAGPTAVALTWPAVAGAVAYAVYQAEESAAPPGLSATAVRLLGTSALRRVQGDIAGTSAIVAGLNAGATYRFVVRAQAEGGREVAESEPARVTLPTVAPPTLTVTSAPGAAVLSWDPVPEAASYTVLIAVGNGPLAPDPLRASLTATTTTVDRLAPGAYVFQIEAHDAAGGRLARSNPAQVLIGPTAAFGPPAPPAAALAPATGPSAPAPSPATASAGGTPGFVLTLVRTGPSEVRLNWPPLHGIGSYAVYQAQGDTPLSFAFTTGTPGTTLTGLAPGTSYTFQVRARDAAGREVATSNTVTLQLGPG